MIRPSFPKIAKTIKHLFLALGLAAVATTAHAQLQSTAPALEIGNDRGGLLRERIREIKRIEQSGQPVRITGKICYSTCTMFLGLENTCVSPSTTFGFHGPSSYGLPLEKAVFDRASEIIAGHYPAGLKEWYMTTGRHKIWTIHRIKGTEIIRMGIPSC